MTTRISSLISSLGPGVANHLWQSTLFAAVMVLVCLALRRNAARVRYAIWFAASMKFLVPFSLLIGLGGLLPKHHVVTASAPAGIYSAVDAAALPFSNVLGGVENNAIRAHRSSWERAMAVLPDVIAAVWLFGMVMVLLNWFVRWRRMYATLRQATIAESGREVEILRRVERAAGMRQQVTLLLSEGLMEPGILGVRRLRLIWPARLSERLEDEHIETIVTHELMHVRRRDNLTVMLHMVVEALFWFHPLVWWMERRMVEEREHACDEAVVAAGGRPEVYAEGLLKAVRFCVESPMACVPGISGADLSRRVRSIMTMRVMQLSMAKKVALVVLALATAAVPIALGQVKATEVRSETELVHPVDPMPAYEVATVKPWDGQRSVQALRTYIQYAFGIQSTSKQRLIGPEWIDKKSWVTQGKIPDALQESMHKMGNNDRTTVYRRLAQSLLAERFKLKVHFETREMPILELVQAKGGAKLKPVENPDPHGGASMGPHGQLTNLKAVSAPMSAIIQMLSLDPDIGGRPLVDKTGLTGGYDLNMNWLSSRLPSPMGAGTIWQPWVPGPAPAGDIVGPSLSAALEEVGLKLVQSKGSVEVVVIDHIEEPSEN